MLLADAPAPLYNGELHAARFQLGDLRRERIAFWQRVQYRPAIGSLRFDPGLQLFPFPILHPTVGIFNRCAKVRVSYDVDPCGGKGHAWHPVLGISCGLSPRSLR
jgi:hypothetical protein